MYQQMLRDVKAHLSRRKADLPRIAADTGLSYSLISALAYDRYTSEPKASNIEKLAKYLSKPKAQPKAARAA